MKLHYYLMSMAVAATALVGFTACDDDDSYDDVYVIGGNANSGNVAFTEADLRVKIGEDNRVALPVEGNKSDLRAYSLDPEVAEVVYVDGVPYVEGLKNGSTKIMVSDGNGNYEPLVVAVYTTDEMTLTYSNLEVTAVVGKTVAVTGVGVNEGNGGYTATSDDNRVTVFIDAESGLLAVNATAEEDAYTCTVTVTDQSMLSADLAVSVGPATHKVKIGTATREALPFTGDYEAQIVGEKAEIYTDASGKKYIEGLANGTAVVTAQQGDTYYYYTYSVYTTDVLTLNMNTLAMTTPLGIQSRNTEVSVALGNGDYTISSDNADVKAQINKTTGAVTITATSRMNPYTANVTIQDCTGLTATLAVTVTASMEAFTADEIADIKAMTESTVFGQVKDPSDGTAPYYYTYYRDSYGEWLNETSGDTQTIGWWMIFYGYDYGGLKIDFPASAQVDEELTGKLYYQYSTSSWYPCYEYEGNVKVIRNDATALAVIFWQIDTENERINRGYVVIVK